MGAFRAIYESAQRQPAERVLVRPFPGNAPASRRTELFRRREDLISQVGSLIVVAGNKVADDGGVILSNGVEEEVQIALRLGKPVIPVGLTGHVAHAVWEAVRFFRGREVAGVVRGAKLKRHHRRADRPLVLDDFATRLLSRFRYLEATST